MAARRFFGLLGVFLAMHHEPLGAVLMVTVAAACWITLARCWQAAAFLALLTAVCGYATWRVYITPSPRPAHWWMAPVFYAIVIGCDWYQVMSRRFRSARQR